MEQPQIEKGLDPLKQAIIDGNIHELKKLLAEKVQEKRYLNDLLIFAVEREGGSDRFAAQIIPLLVGKGAEVGAQNQAGERLLAIAVKRKYSETAKALLAQKAVDYDGQSLKAAVLDGSTDIIKIFLEHNSSEILKLIVNPTEKDTLLTWAIRGDHFEIFEEISKRKGIPAVIDPEKNKAFKLIASKDPKKITPEFLAFAKELLITIDFNKTLGDGNTLLIWAIKNGNPKSVKEIFSSINRTRFLAQKDAEGNDPLFLAAQKAREYPEKSRERQLCFEIVKMLQNNGFDLNKSVNNAGDSLLVWAIKTGEPDIVTGIFDKNFDISNISQKDSSGDSLLLLAAKQAIKYLKSGEMSKYDSYVAIIKTIINAGFHPNQVVNDSKDSLLTWAAAHVPFPTDFFSMLLGIKGFDIDAPDQNGNTPLISAIREGLTENVKALLDPKMAVDVNAKALGGNSPFSIAVSGNRKDIVRLLLKTEKITPNEEQAQFLLAIQNGYTDVVNVFLEEHPDIIRVKERFASDALRLAAQNGKTEVVTVLLKHLTKEEINAQDKNDYNALMLAAKYGHANVVEMLAKNLKVDIDLGDKTRFGSALVLATYYDHQDVVEKLLATRANVNAQDDSGFTALTWAVITGNIEIVQQLLDHGAKIYLSPESDVNALNYAIFDDKPEIALLLLRQKGEFNVNTKMRGYVGEEFVEVTPLLSAAGKAQKYSGLDGKPKYEMYVEIGCILLEKGAELGEVLEGYKNYFENILRFAIKTEKYDVVEKLMKNGVSLENAKSLEMEDKISAFDKVIRRAVEYATHSKFADAKQCIAFADKFRKEFKLSTSRLSWFDRYGKLINLAGEKIADLQGQAEKIQSPVKLDRPHKPEFVTPRNAAKFRS